MAANPMSQFNVYRIGPEIKIGTLDISFTNASLFMIISTLSILLIFNLGSKKNTLLPNKLQLLAELSYTFVSKMMSDTAGSKAKPYFAFIFSLFMFVLFCNMFGMIPYTFTVTSHIIVTFVLAAFIFTLFTIYFAWLSNHKTQETNYCILFSAHVWIKAEPSTNAESNFKLHEGSKMKIIDENENWLEISFDEKIGWVEKKDVQRI